MEAQAFRTNIVAVIAKFSYDHILTRFGCPLTIMTNQGTHFINDEIKYFTNHFIHRHTSSIISCPQENGHVESTNKVFWNLINQIG